MKFTLLGTGTSQGIPVLGCRCEVCISEDVRDHRQRTAGLIESKGKYIVIDVGPDFRHQMLGIDAPRLDAILLTHEHNDHMIGLDDVRPYNFRQKEPIVVYGLARVLDDVQARFPYVFLENKYPGAPSLQLRRIEPGQPIFIDDIEIMPFTVLHGGLSILGFRCGDLSYITDAKEIPDESMQIIRGSKRLVVNALHHRKHHSHFNLEEAVNFALDIGADRTYFTHISHSMGIHAEINSTLPAGIELGYDGLTVDI